MEHRVTTSQGADPGANPVAGWRTRSIALATLGAVSLSREAFGPRARAQLAPLALQILVAVALQDHAATDPSGYVDGLLAVLTADAEGEAAVEQLVEAGLVQAQGTLADEADEADEAWLTLTELGAKLLGSWLMNISPLFTRWPPDQMLADDAR